LDSLNKDSKNLLIIDSILFILLAILVNSYRFFFLVLTCAILSYLIYQLLHFLIQLNRPSELSPYERQVLNFLFRNESVYQWYRKNSSNRFIKMSSSGLVASQEQRDNLCEGIDTFLKKFSVKFIQTWYCSSVSRNDQFLVDVHQQLEVLFNDVFKRFIRVNKLNLLASGVFIMNKNFANMAMGKGEGISLMEQLHPAVRNTPSSEIAYIKRFVQIVLRKSAPNLNINQAFVEELFGQVIGKNCLEYLVNLLAKPNFIYFIIACLIDKDRTLGVFTPFDEISSEKTPAVPTNTNDTASSSAKPNTHPRKPTITMRKQSSPLELDLSRNAYSMRNPVYEGSQKTETLYFQIISLHINDTEISVELRTGKEFTLYNIKVSFFF
jgi:hypothetical protein